ncbi:MAG: ectoine/hydroxyectoine ABC transporter permease subunit EhuC [Dehalococcoidia bacterium]
MNQLTLWDYMPFLLKGIPLTMQVTAMGITLAVFTALLLAVGRMSKILPVRWAAGFVIELFRGTSALVQLFWAFYVLPFFGLELSPLFAGVMVLGLNEGSYFAEVIRPALQSVVGGQRDAAITLHLPRWYRFRRIMLPQALPVMIPPFGNALVGMLKFTSLVSLVTLQDLAFRASMIRSNLGQSGPTYTVTLIIYFILAIMLAGLVKLLERHVNRKAGRDVPPLSWSQLKAPSPVPAWAFFGR